MKINNKKIIVSTLALAMGAALAGSVSGTVAWFQYSTRAQGTYIGLSAHCSEMLEISANGGAFASEVNGIESASGFGTNLTPISSGEMAEDDELPTSFYKNPVYQYNDPAVWGEADDVNFAQFTLNLHVRDIDGTDSAYLDNHNLYLTNIDIVSLTSEAGNATSNLDLKKAVRVHITDGSSYNALFALGDGSEATVSTVTHGNLDLNNDGVVDQTPGYTWTTGRTDIDYGVPTPTSGDPVVPGDQVAYDIAKLSNFADDSDPTAIDDTTAAPGLIAAIPADEDGIELTVTIWLEGWTQLSDGAYDGTASKVWDPETYIGKYFGVGFRFATELHDDTHA